MTKKTDQTYAIVATIDGDTVTDIYVNCIPILSPHLTPHLEDVRRICQEVGRIVEERMTSDEEVG